MKNKIFNLSLLTIGAFVLFAPFAADAGNKGHHGKHYKRHHSHSSVSFGAGFYQESPIACRVYRRPPPCVYIVPRDVVVYEPEYYYYPAEEYYCYPPRCSSSLSFSFGFGR